MLTEFYEIFNRFRIVLIAVTAILFLSMPIAYTKVKGSPLIDLARLVKKDIERIQTGVIDPLGDLPNPISIPTLDGNYLFATFGQNLYKYDLTHYLDFLKMPGDVRFFRNSSMSTWAPTEVHQVNSLKENVDPEFIALLTHHPTLKLYYSAPIILNGNRSKFTPGVDRLVDVDYSLQFKPGLTEVSFPDSIPTSRVRSLQLELTHLDTADLNIDIYFDNDFGWNEVLGRISVKPKWREDENTSFVIDDDESCKIAINFPQIYAYSLTEKIWNLRLVISPPVTESNIGSIGLSLQAIEPMKRAPLTPRTYAPAQPGTY